jgi:cytochrome c5
MGWKDRLTRLFVGVIVMRTRILLLLIAIAVAIGLGRSALRAQSQAPQRTVLEGVFTDAQANRGRAAIIKIGCADCHGETLEGGPSETPALIGQEFISGWQNQTLLDLFNKLNSMPPDKTEKISAQDYVDIMTLLLRSNGYPAGNTELSTSQEVLGQIKIVP